MIKNFPHPKKTMHFLRSTLLSLALAASAFALESQSPLQSQTPISPSPHLPIPLLGYGTWNLERSNASDAVAVALETGYKHIDCAAAYGNQKEVGRGIEEGLKGAGAGRGDVWITSKLWNDQ